MAGVNERINALEERFRELERELSAPDAHLDRERVQRLSQEQARLRDVVLERLTEGPHLLVIAVGVDKNLFDEPIDVVGHVTSTWTATASW